MAMDQFIHFLPKGKVQGETKDKAMKADEAVDVLAWSWGEQNSGSFGQGGGGGAGVVNMQNLAFTHYIDKATPNLMQRCATGDHLDGAVLTVRKAGGKQENYLIVTMDKVMVTGVSTGGSGGEDRLTENVTLDYAKIKVEYFYQDDTGATKPGPVFTWDREAKTK